MNQSTFILFLLCTAVSSWAQILQVNELAELPSTIQETSGIENGPNGWFWTHNDGGNPAEIHCIDTNGVIQRTVSITGDSNTDWEDIAKDDEGNLYIGNFGNNSLNRTDLRVIKIPNADTCTVSCAVSDTISFTYPDQFDFPPNGDYGNFDMEAMFWFQDSLHLFSKDRSSPSTGYTKQYRLPTITGQYQAFLVDSLNTESASFINAITAADISTDGEQVVLLNADHIWLITDFQGSNFFSGSVSQLSLGSFTQKEGICFHDGFIYLTDEREQFFGTGGKLYRLHPSVFVGVDDVTNQSDVVITYNQDYVLQGVRVESSVGNASWRLFTTEGKLVNKGEITSNGLTRTQLNVGSGVYVLQVFINQQPVKSVLVRL